MQLSLPLVGSEQWEVVPGGKIVCVAAVSLRLFAVLTHVECFWNGRFQRAHTHTSIFPHVIRLHNLRA